MRRLILSFHEVSWKLRRPWCVTPTFLEQCLEVVREKGFRFCTLSELLSSDATTPLCTVCLDDGRVGSWVEGGPILSKHAISAVYYLPTAWLDGEDLPRSERYSEILRWPDLAAIVEGGHEIGSHSHHHVRLASLEDSVIETELRISKDMLENATGRRCAHFAAPYGDCDSRVVNACSKIGYRSIATTFDGLLASRSTLLRRVLIQDQGAEATLDHRLNALLAEIEWPVVGILTTTSNEPSAAKFGRADLKILSSCATVLASTRNSYELCSGLGVPTALFPADLSATALARGIEQAVGTQMENAKTYQGATHMITTLRCRDRVQADRLWQWADFVAETLSAAAPHLR
jgi:hypothetical protein